MLFWLTEIVLSEIIKVNQKHLPEITMKKLGRPPIENKSINLHWRVPFDIYQLLKEKQKKIESDTGIKCPMSKVLEGVVKKSLN